MDKDLVDRLREHADRRPAAVPDTDGEVRAALDRLDELLGAVVDDDSRGSPSSAGQLTPAARQALWRLSRAVSEAERAPVAQPVAPDGRYEFVPLAWVAVERADLVAVGLAVQALGRGVGDDDDEDVTDAEAARLHGLLSLPWDDDVALLAGVLAAGAGRVVLDEAAHQAYQRVVKRILGIWHVGDALAPLLYRGR